MKRDYAIKILPIIQAYAEGKEIETLGDDNEWYVTDDPLFFGGVKYRIKDDAKN